MDDPPSDFANNRTKHKPANTAAVQETVALASSSQRQKLKSESGVFTEKGFQQKVNAQKVASPPLNLAGKQSNPAAAEQSQH